MSSLTTDVAFARSGPLRRRAAALPLLFGTTILSSACLLFLVQPLASKLILPWFGGSAAVWITCMLFFQAGLLLGYSYAHALARRMSPKRQAMVHGAVLVVSLFALPILPNPMWQPQAGQDPTWRVFGVLATSVGLPYLLLSSTSPLLQSWYATTREGALPYRYFALSNAGSLVALVSYPVLVEPYLTGHEQAWLWSAGFAIFVVLCLTTAWATSGAATNTAPSAVVSDTTRAPLGDICLWVALAACASALLLTVTNLLTQNIAPMPLLWVLPLSIYLLSFILSFEGDRWYRRGVFLPLLLPALAILGASTGKLENEAISITVPLFSVALFICCMACHGELARMKPGPANLTMFYLSLAGGGAAGGLFVALLAPHLFATTYEYGITFVGCAALLLLLFWREKKVWRSTDRVLATWLAAAAATLVFAGYMAQTTWHDVSRARLMKRNFYGALRVDDFRDGRLRVRELSHGTITHGRQILMYGLKQYPTTYYGANSGIGLTWRALERTGPLRMGIVGLGAGTLAAYGRGGDTLRFYDINPLVVDIAKTQFSFLSACPAHVDIVLGDARLSMVREPNQQFDILVVDAFSGDAIPVHLLTREAFQVYWRHLKPDGVLAVHISNHYLDLAPEVLLNAQAMGKQALEVDNDDDDQHEVFSASYVLVSSRPNFFENELFKRKLIKISPPRGMRPWTDDFSNLWQVLNWKTN